MMLWIALFCKSLSNWQDRLIACVQHRKQPGDLAASPNLHLKLVRERKGFSTSVFMISQWPPCLKQEIVLKDCFNVVPYRILPIAMQHQLWPHAMFVCKTNFAFFVLPYKNTPCEMHTLFCCEGIFPSQRWNLSSLWLLVPLRIWLTDYREVYKLVL